MGCFGVNFGTASEQVTHEIEIAETDKSNRSMSQLPLFTQKSDNIYGNMHFDAEQSV